MPALALDFRHMADRHVCDPHPRVRLNVVDIGHLRLNHEGARAVALGAGQRQRIQPAPTAAGYPGQDDECRQSRRYAAQAGASHEPPPWGTIRPGSPAAGFVATVAVAGVAGPGASAGNGAPGGPAAGGGPGAAAWAGGEVLAGGTWSGRIQSSL